MKRLILIILVAFAFSSIAATIYFDFYPNNPNPPGSYILPLQTGDKSQGGTPYNWITLDQLGPALSSNTNFSGSFIPTSSGKGTNITLNGTSTFTGVGTGVIAGPGTIVYGDVSGTTNKSVVIYGTTNQIVFGGTNAAPSTTTNAVVWVSVNVSGDTNQYRIPLYK